MHVEQKCLAILDEAVGILQVGLPLADGLDLGPAQRHARFKLLQQKIIMAGGPIVRGVPLTRGHGVPWLGWLGGAGSGRLNNYVAGLASHSEASSSLHPNIGEFFPPPRGYWCGISLSSSGALLE